MTPPRAKVAEPFPAPDVLPDGVTVQHTRARNLLVPEGTAALVLTDPPWHLSAADVWYELADVAARALRPGGHLATYCGQLMLPHALRVLGERLDYRWTAAALRSASHPVWGRAWVVAKWRPILVFRLGIDARRRQFIDVLGASVALAAEKSGHPWQQQEAEASYLIERLTDPGDLVVDPFCGSGTVGAAALKLGRRAILGDIDERALEQTRWRLAAQETVA